jgi:glyoxylase-like metal-dependent hydrolase (beta-lactamase superfamily II)
MEIAPGIYSLRQLRGIFVHAFLLDDGASLTLIDTLYAQDAQPILDEIARIGKKVTDLKRIVLTHAHRAHLGGLAVLKEASGASVYCHAWESDIVTGGRAQQCMPLRPMRPLILWPFQVGSRFTRHRPSPVDHTLADGDEVGPLTAIQTPGHTPGHLAFYWPEQRALFAGDALVTWPDFAPGWPGFNLNREQNWTSVVRMAELDAEILAVGHGDPITVGGADRLRTLVQEAGV